MKLTWLQQPGWIALGAALAMLTLWFVQRRTRDAGIVDVGWAACLGSAAVFCAWTGAGDDTRRVLVGAMGGAWGLRLAAHLLFDRVLKGPEDGRYQMMREQFGTRIQPVLLAFFLAQALLVVILSPPFVLAAADPHAPRLLDGIALAVWLAGWLGELLADHQLRSFKQDPSARGRVCTVGLWRWSRHPNYFFEWVMWIAFALLATGAPHGWVAWSAPALMLIFILKLTGIPPTEARALRSRGEAYREYQRSTSAFVPWFPKSTRKSRQP
ncbi:MAG: DUF1295 domain-containing protein [Phycisphaerales bacterium]|nr:DUF1295 domain-containing protein [Phycisphaerales bacterium]